MTNINEVSYKDILGKTRSRHLDMYLYVGRYGFLLVV